MKLSGWGQFPVADCRLDTVSRVEDVRRSLDQAASLIPRGNGRSYGDAALNDSCTLGLTGLNRLLAFDPETGHLTAEAGVLLADLLDVFVPRGWFPLVTPGTKYVTLGGMVAADVHGKNHHRDGSFAGCVVWLDLLLADGQEVRCDRTQNAELFQATLGGMGLTGIVLRVCFRLRRIETAYVRQRTVVAEDLDAAIDAFAESQAWTYSVGWMDTLARGRKLGRSIVTLGEHANLADLSQAQAAAPLRRPRRRQVTVPRDAPPGLLNRGTARAFNGLYYARNARDGQDSLIDVDRYFYPLDAVQDWNRFYGPAGFTQYQCVLPLDCGRAGLVELLETVGRANVGAFLSVLKRFGPQEGLLSFPMEGYTLTMDFPMGVRTLNLLEALDSIVLRYGGRLYLAKDARMGAGMLRAGYPGLDAFRRLRRESGADRRFHSLLTRRLDL